MKRQLIWCLSLGTVTAAATLWWLGFRPVTIAFVLLMAVCPAIIILGAIHLYRDSNQTPHGERTPRSDAMTRKHSDRP